MRTTVNEMAHLTCSPFLITCHVRARALRAADECTAERRLFNTEFDIAQLDASALAHVGGSSQRLPLSRLW
jgi:hypothetical protein